MDWLDVVLRSVLFVLVLYAGWLCIRIIRWAFRTLWRGARHAHKLPRAAGGAAAVAVDAARSVKNQFVDGYKRKG